MRDPDVRSHQYQYCTPEFQTDEHLMHKLFPLSDASLAGSLFSFTLFFKNIFPNPRTNGKDHDSANRSYIMNFISHADLKRIDFDLLELRPHL
jgi:hypothetical protein